MNNENKLVKESIMEALINLIEYKTIDKISITEITRKAGVGRVSFYRNFECKEKVLECYLEKITNEFIVNTEESFKDKDINSYFTILFTNLKKYKNLTFNLYKSNCLYLVEEQINRLFDIINNDYDEHKKHFLVGGIYNIYLNWIKNGCRESPSEIADYLTKLIKK